MKELHHKTLPGKELNDIYQSSLPFHLQLDGPNESSIEFIAFLNELQIDRDDNKKVFEFSISSLASNGSKISVNDAYQSITIESPSLDRVDILNSLANSLSEKVNFEKNTLALKDEFALGPKPLIPTKEVNLSDVSVSYTKSNSEKIWSSTYSAPSIDSLLNSVLQSKSTFDASAMRKLFHPHPSSLINDYIHNNQADSISALTGLNMDVAKGLTTQETLWVVNNNNQEQMQYRLDFLRQIQEVANLSNNLPAVDRQGAVRAQYNITKQDVLKALFDGNDQDLQHITKQVDKGNMQSIDGIVKFAREKSQNQSFDLGNLVLASRIASQSLVSDRDTKSSREIIEESSKYDGSKINYVGNGLNGSEPPSVKTLNKSDKAKMLVELLASNNNGQDFQTTRKTQLNLGRGQ